MVRLLFAVWLAGCAVGAPALTPDHPANPAAPIGRLAPPPDALGLGSLPEHLARPMSPMHHHP